MGGSSELLGYHRDRQWGLQLGACDLCWLLCGTAGNLKESGLWACNPCCRISLGDILLTKQRLLSFVSSYYSDTVCVYQLT